jgi:hypothetical protein
MGFNGRKMEDQRRHAAEKEAATRRATDAQVLEDAERLIAAWNERQAERMPMLFSPTIGAAGVDHGGGKRGRVSHYCLFLAAAGGAGRTSAHGSEFFFSASGRPLTVDW